MKNLIAIILLASSWSASAEFSVQEKAEVLDFHWARWNVIKALDRIGQEVRNGAGPSRFEWGDVLVRLNRLSEADCGEAHAQLLGSGSRELGMEEGDGRPESLVLAQGAMTACRDGAAQLSVELQAVPNAAFTSAADNLDAAVDLIDAFDWSLSYDSPFVDAHPRIIGPHGHLELAMHSLFATEQSMADSLDAGMKVYRDTPIWPTAGGQQPNLGNADFWASVMIVNYTDVLEHLLVSNTMHAGVLTQQEQTVINQMTAAGSGLRGPEFFRLLRIDEHVLGNQLGVQRPNWQPRAMLHGASGDMRYLLQGFNHMMSELVQVNDEAWMSQVFGPTGQAFLFQHPVGEWWGMLDSWSGASTQFFFEIPPIPEGGECPPVTDEVLRVDSVVFDDIAGTVQFSCRI